MNRDVKQTRRGDDSVGWLEAEDTEFSHLHIKSRESVPLRDHPAPTGLEGVPPQAGLIT